MAIVWDVLGYQNQEGQRMAGRGMCVQLASKGQRLGMLLNSLQCIRQPPTTEDYLAQNGNNSYFTHKAQFRLASFQVLNSHMELVATILDSAAL